MKKAKDNQKILLVDISTWKGHHAIYFKKILRSLIQEQYFVYASCEDNLALSQWLKDANIQDCTVLDWNLSFAEKLLFKSLGVLDRVTNTFFRKSLYQFSSISSLLFARDLLRKIGRSIPIFFADSDTSIPVIPLWFAKILLPDQWITLAIQPSYQSAISWGKRKSRQRFISEKLFSLSSCKAVLTLHPAYLNFFRTRCPEDKFFALPEIVDTKFSKLYEIPSKIQYLAAGRKIISITGALLPKRNLKLFLQAAQQLNPNEYFIIAIGHLPRHCYSPAEIQIIEELSLTLPNNSYLNFDYYISEEGEFNQLLSISDIIYLQYHQHSFSSNILTKAIKLRKPVIIGDNYIMQKVLKEYDWEAIAPEEPQQLARVMMEVANSFKIDEEKYEQFLLDFCDDKFHQAICNSIELLEL